MYPKRIIRRDRSCTELKKLNPMDVYQSKDKNFMYYSFVYVVDEFIPILNDEIQVMLRMEWMVGPNLYMGCWKHIGK